MRAARGLTCPGAGRGGWPARGGSGRDSGTQEVAARARARIPGAPPPRPATHGAESRQPLSLSRPGAATGAGEGRKPSRRRPRAPGVPRGRQRRTRATPLHRLGHSGRSGGGSPGRPVPAALAARRKQPAARDCARPPAQAHQPPGPGRGGGPGGRGGRAASGRSSGARRESLTAYGGTRGPPGDRGEAPPYRCHSPAFTVRLGTRWTPANAASSPASHP